MTRESYAFIDLLKKHRATPCGVTLGVATKGGREYVELNTHRDQRISPELIEEALQVLRKIQVGDVQVQIEAEALVFETGQQLYDWAEDEQTTIKPGEVKQ